MRQLKNFDEERTARACSNLLETEDIENEVRSGDSGVAVWVLSDEDLPRARALLDRFDPAQGAQLAREANALREQRASARRPVKMSRTPSRVAGTTQMGPAVMALAAAVLLVAYFEQFRGESLTVLTPYPFGIWRQPWRIVGPIFRHFGLLHLIFNLMWLKTLGSQMEAEHGALRFSVFVLASGFVSNLAQLYISGPYFGGLSGVNYGLFGFVWMQARYGRQSGYALSSGDTALMMVWLVVCASGVLGPVADAAHAVGLAVGLLTGLPGYIAFRRTHRVRREIEAGSWEDLNIRGYRRFDRLYIQPYLPAWFMGVAIAVLVYSLPG